MAKRWSVRLFYVGVSFLSFWGVGRLVGAEVEELTPEQFRILRQKGTERAFSGAYWNTKEKGIYRCAGCGNELFGSDAKFDSGTGWPSFWRPVSPEKIHTQQDRGWFMQRTEVLCGRCDGHLGHLFEDGPPPTGLRYCINSGALKFEKKEGGQ